MKYEVSIEFNIVEQTADRVVGVGVFRWQLLAAGSVLAEERWASGEQNSVDLALPSNPVFHHAALHRDFFHGFG